MSERSDVDDDHLDGIEDGCGCAEVWEAMSERREVSGASDARDD